MVIKKRQANIRNSLFYFFSFKFVGTVLFEVLFAWTGFFGFITSSHVVTKLWIILDKYLLCLQLGVDGFQV